MAALLGLASGILVACSHLGFADAAVQELRDQADLAMEEGQWARAYGHLKTLRLEYPDHPATAEAFPIATALYTRLFYQHRHTEPDSAWLTSEPEFLFAWLESFYAEAEAYPRDSTEALLVGLPWSFSQRFVAWAAVRPTLGAWDFRVIEDNGIVESVTAERADRTADAPAPRDGG